MIRRSDQGDGSGRLIRAAFGSGDDFETAFDGEPDDFASGETGCSDGVIDLLFEVVGEFRDVVRIFCRLEGRRRAVGSAGLRHGVRVG